MAEYEMLVFPEHWIQKLISLPSQKGEIQLIIITLKTGVKYKGLLENSMYLTYIEGHKYIPFSVDDIEHIEGLEMTHDNIDLKAWLKRVSELCEKDIYTEPLPEKSVKKGELK